jgi:hypothetical protein
MEIVLWVGSVIVAVLISHFYYKRSISKVLSFFLLLDDKPLSHVSPDVRERLEFTFKAAPEQPPPDGGAVGEGIVGALSIESLHHLQLVIANTGVRAISFKENPCISIPSDNLILDASLIYRKPRDLGAEIIRLPVGEDKCQKLKIAVPVLNRDEYVILKLLLSGEFDTSSLKLQLLSEDLERSIGVTELPPQATKSFRESIEWSAIWVGGILLLFCSSVLIISNSYDHLNIVQWDGLVDFIKKWMDIDHIALIISTVGATLFGLVGVALLFGIGLIPPFRKIRLVIPSELKSTKITVQPDKDK